MEPTVADDGKLPYFAYGSNLTAARLHMGNPSAVFETIARLDGYRLEFDNSNSSIWRGATATITKSMNDHVWGVLWFIDKVNLPSLDLQEGVAAGIYEPIEVVVTRQDGRQIQCRTYNLLKRGCEDRRPSPQYLDIIIRGAIKHQLPHEYIAKLKAFEHNGFPGPLPLYETIIAKLES